ncbi:N-acetylneuraminate synthase [Gimesia panareensis]|uniref:N,N'-diacetyllegionaminic acid synthase n=1 Tax=Gimesia panareensis TaxID=2527978 RepID=A0A517Q839_9PLAN|nr:N-acetylneuraminate synthase [Gimesia panareensis]QDT27797.1 N,N'-diacetyllegionaminic acid synthase [Gimesia panareensis]QDU49383.1 N,N'-diacetyllegionaminic acid synthase [Gimesia panareensis]
MSVFVIAEAGVNHNGSVETAKKMIDAAVQAGADAIKFQTFKTEKLVCKSAPQAEYQMKNSAEGESDTQFTLLKKLEINQETHRELFDYCEQSGIVFISTPFDLESIDLLKSLGLELIKVPSGEITNYPYLKKVAQTFHRVVLSTGMADLGEIEDALAILIDNGIARENITVLHCNTEYPTPIQDVNLRAMLTIRDAFGVKVGYSDHTLGIEVSIAATALGATVIEKHFTLDKNMEGPDHAASLEPDELMMLVRGIRNTEKSLGSPLKRPSASESKNKPVVRKSIIAARDIKQGETFTEANLCVKRPGTGISPMQWDQVINQVARRDYVEDEIIEL